MKALSFLITVLIVMANQSFAATHMFWCSTGVGGPNAQQFSFEIKDEALNSGNSGTGTITLSNWNQELVTWQPFMEAQAPAKINWSWGNGLSVITGIEVDLGRSGYIQARTLKPYENFNSAPGVIVSNVMGFNYPQATSANYCSYFHKTKIRPGVTGSN